MENKAFDIHKHSPSFHQIVSFKSNALAQSQCDELQIYGNISDAVHIVKSSYSEGTSFSADLILKMIYQKSIYLPVHNEDMMC